MEWLFFSLNFFNFYTECCYLGKQCCILLNLIRIFWLSLQWLGLLQWEYYRMWPLISRRSCVTNWPHDFKILWGIFNHNLLTVLECVVFERCSWQLYDPWACCIHAVVISLRQTDQYILIPSILRSFSSSNFRLI